MKSFVILIAFLASGSIWAADCPVQFGHERYLEEVGDAILASNSCFEGAAIAKNCALAASGDQFTARVAQGKCEAGFVKKLSKSEAASYRRLHNKCISKYKDMSGTMYISFAAFCRLSVAELYSELYTPAE